MSSPASPSSMTDLVGGPPRKATARGVGSAGSICDLAGLDPSSPAPASATVTHLGGAPPSSSWVIPAHIPAFVVRRLLSPTECAAIIAATPSGGPGFMNEAQVAARYRGRVCTRLASHDPSMSSLVERRLRALDLLPPELDGGTLLGVSPRWRHVHYTGTTRGHQEHHIDGREPLPAAAMTATGEGAATTTTAAATNNHTGEAKGAAAAAAAAAAAGATATRMYRQSRLTCMVYLNTGGGVDFEGGATTFLDDGLKPRLGGEHAPSAGDCLCFYQESYHNRRSLLLHRGSDVTAGEKRMMRTVVDYGGFATRAACKRCLWADELDRQEEEELRELDRRMAAQARAGAGVPERMLAQAQRVVSAAASAASAGNSSVPPSPAGISRASGNINYRGATLMKALVGEAFLRLEPHERLRGHPAWMLHELLKRAPVDGKIWDVLGHVMFACRAVGMPPAIGGAPGKSLVLELYGVYCEKKGAVAKPAASKEAEEAKEAEDARKRKRLEGFAQWKDTSKLLIAAIQLMFQKMEETFKTSEKSK